MPQAPSLLRTRSLSAASVLALAVGVAAQTQGPTVEERLRSLEQAVRQERLGVGTTEAAFSIAWVDADAAGVPNFQDSPKAPAVASTVDLKLWGRVNFAATYDNFQGAGGVGGNDFHNYITSEGNEELNFNARDSRFGFAAANTWDDWTGRAVFEFDFYGTTSGANQIPRLRLGYVELVKAGGFSVRAGQDWVPIAAQNPGTIDFGILGWSGNLWNRVPQITMRYASGDLEGTFGVMHNRVAGAQDQQERMPWVMARLGLSMMEKKGLVAIGGGIRENTITPTAGASTGIDQDASSYLVALEAKLPVCSTVSMVAELWTGSGVGSEFVRAGLDYDATGDTMDGSGGFVSVEWKVADTVSITVGGGVDQPANDDTTPATAFGTAVPFDANQTVFANFRHQLSKQFGWGFEVMDMQTDALAPVGDDGLRLRGQRVTLGSWFIF
jgi:hypothetical protein